MPKNLGGCRCSRCHEGRPHVDTEDKPVDHSGTIPDGGGDNPTPPKIPAEPNDTLYGLSQFCKHFNCSRMQLHRWNKLVPFPVKWKRVYRWLRYGYEATPKELDLWFIKVCPMLDRVWSQHTENVRYH